MNGELRPIRPQDLGEVLSNWTPRLAEISDPLLEGTFLGQRLCLVGFISETFLSDRAYLWLDTYPAAAAHPFIIARWARYLIPVALRRYPTIIGHCGNDSCRWLQTLGAQITGTQFEIRAT